MLSRVVIITCNVVDTKKGHLIGLITIDDF